MILSFYGISYLTISLGLAIIAYRCFETAKIEKGGKVAKLFSYFFSIFSLITFMLGFSSIFGNNLSGYNKIIFFFIYILLTIGCATLGYLILYLKSQKINSWFGSVPILFIGIIATIIDYLWGQPSITQSGQINWGLPPLGYILQFSLFLFTFLPMGILLLQQARISQSTFLKTKAVLFSFVAFGGFFIALAELIIKPLLEFNNIVYLLIFLNIVLFTFLVTSERDFEK